MSITVTMTDQKTWHTAFKALTKAGVHVRTLRDSKKVLYIHAKAIVADFGRTGQQVFLGSENFSMASLRPMSSRVACTERPPMTLSGRAR